LYTEGAVKSPLRMRFSGVVETIVALAIVAGIGSTRGLTYGPVTIIVAALVYGAVSPGLERSAGNVKILWGRQSAIQARYQHVSSKCSKTNPGRRCYASRTAPYAGWIRTKTSPLELIVLLKGRQNRFETAGTSRSAFKGDIAECCHRHYPPAGQRGCRHKR